jgi:flagellar M-ring protein FliF
MLNSYQKTWAGLTVGQRLALGAVLVAVFAGILLVANWAGRPTYGVLFSNLEPEDAGAVTGKLREQKIDYRLGQGGRSIEVPEDKVYDLRLAMATEGLPRGGSAGFELFDKTNFSATDFTQHLNYRRALEGELGRTIRELEGVLDGRVHLAMPEKRLFIEKEEPVTASIVLHLRPGYQITERQVGGIVHLVSRAVEGLKPANVTVHDSLGELLSPAGGGAAGAPLSGHQVETQERYERNLETELQQLGDQVLGPGRAAVRVSAELNWDQTETTSETFKPSGPGGKNLPTQDQATTETYAPRSARIPRGVPGVASNTNAPVVVGDARDGGQYTNSRTEHHYAVSKVVERRVAAPGKVRRLSIAVLLDKTISRAQQEALKNAFAAAAGLDLDPIAEGGRGDRIELTAMAFDKTTVTQAKKAAETEAKKSFQSQLMRNGAAVLIVVLVLVASLLVARQLLATPKHSVDALLAESVPLNGSPPAGDQSVGYARPATAAAHRGAAEGGERRPLSRTDQVRRVAAERPDEVARQIQRWMNE